MPSSSKKTCSFAYVWSVASLSAQTVLGTITGRVVDASSASVSMLPCPPPTRGPISHIERRRMNPATTSSSNFPSDVRTCRRGHRIPSVHRERNIELNVAQTLSLDATSKLARWSRRSKSRPTSATLQTSTSDLGTTIQRNKLVDLPLFVGGNIRNLEQFIFLAPGVTGDTGNTQISGSPSRAKEVLVDGMASTGIESGGVIPGSGRPSVETIGEFRLLRANFNAEYGRTGGGVQIFTTRSRNQRTARLGFRLSAQR